MAGDTDCGRRGDMLGIGRIEEQAMDLKRRMGLEMTAHFILTANDLKICLPGN